MHGDVNLQQKFDGKCPKFQFQENEGGGVFSREKVYWSDRIRAALEFVRSDNDPWFFWEEGAHPR